MSEKLDGVRAFWNGSILISRNGSKIKCPDWFTYQLPKDISLDGELWNGRGTLEMLMKVLTSSDAVGWDQVSLILFDLPNSREPYEIRIRNLANLTLPNYVQIINVNQCRENEDIGKHLAMIVDLGGEGMIANKAKSYYKPMRVESLLKVKVSTIVSVH
jgi:DNA ligase-1